MAEICDARLDATCALPPSPAHRDPVTVSPPPAKTTPKVPPRAAETLQLACFPGLAQAKKFSEALKVVDSTPLFISAAATAK
jgi:hypothetical protein